MGARAGAYSEGGHAPQSSTEWIFYGKSRHCWDCSLHQKCSVDLKYAKNALAAGALPRTPLGELTTHPQTSQSVAEGVPHPQSPRLSALLAPRFSRLRRSASVAPQCKILATPLLRGNVNNVHVRFIGKRVVGFLLVLIELFFARCYGSRRYGRKYRKSVGGSVSAKFSCKGLDRSFFRFVTMHSDWHF